MKLLTSYCSGHYEAKLWDFGNKSINNICVTQRKGLRRVRGIPMGTYSDLFAPMCNSISISRRNATHCNSPYTIIVCVCVCLCVYVCVCVYLYVAFVDLRKLSEIETSFFKSRGITPDIICKSLTQIGLQITRWRDKMAAVKHYN